MYSLGNRTPENENKQTSVYLFKQKRISLLNSRHSNRTDAQETAVVVAETETEKKETAVVVSFVI